MAKARIALTLLSAAGSCLLGAVVSHPSNAGDYPTAPRTPMAPGTGVYSRDVGRDSGGLIFVEPEGQSRTVWGGELRRRPVVQAPDLISLEAAAISDLSNGNSDVVVSSRADVELILQLYRPDLSQWQEYELAPRSNLSISCAACDGKFKFSFNDGAEQSEIDIEAPSLLRIYPSSDGDRWEWDTFKLQAASKSE